MDKDFQKEVINIFIMEDFKGENFMDMGNLNGQKRDLLRRHTVEIISMVKSMEKESQFLKMVIFMKEIG